VTSSVHGGNTTLLDLSSNSTDDCNAIKLLKSRTTTPPPHQEAAVYIIAPYVLEIVDYTIATLGILLNTFTIAIIGLYKPMHKQWTSYFIINQSVIDTLAAVFLLFSTAFPNDLRRRTPGNLDDEILCRIWFAQIPMYACLINSIYGIVGVSFERFLAVVYPIWHKAKFTRKEAAGVMVVSWVVGPCLYIPYSGFTSALTPDGLCSIFNNYGSVRLRQFSAIFGFIIVYFFPLSVMFYFYTRMIIVFRRKASINVEDIRVDKKETTGDKKDIPRDKKEIPGDKYKTPGDKKNPPGDKMETPGDKMETSVDKRQSPGEPPHVPKMSITESESKTEENANHIENKSIGNLEDIVPVRNLTTVETVQSNSIVASQMSQSKSVAGEGKVLNNVATAPKESASTTRARHSIMKTLVMVTFGFVLCWSWSEIYFLMFHLGYTHVDFTGDFFNFTVVMVFVSCCINPIIYCVKFKQFQNGILWVFGCTDCKYPKKKRISPNSIVVTIVPGNT